MRPSLSKNQLGAEGAQNLAEFLPVLPSLTELNLYGNEVKDEGVTVICEAVQSNKETKLASLNVGINKIGPAGAKSVAAMAAVIASLTRLDVRYHALGEEGEAALRKAIEGRSGFELLL